MGFLIIGLNILLALFGYLLPVPSAILAWREWVKLGQVTAARGWRRTMSHTGIVLLSLGLALWIYAVVREASLHDYSYIAPSAVVGRWGSLGLIIVCAFAEPKLRRYLLLGSVGLLFFFGSSIGDITI